MVACEPDHLKRIEMDDTEAVALDQTVATVLTTPSIQELLKDFARTLIHEDRVLACFGVWVLWPGVGAAWSMITKEARESFPKTLYKSVKQMLAAIEERDDLHRIEATVRYGHPSAHSWIRHLGFEREGLMRNYGMFGVGDFHRYARLR